MLEKRDAAARCPATSLILTGGPSRTRTLMLLGAAVICSGALGYLLLRQVLGVPVSSALVGWTVLSTLTTWAALLCRHRKWCPVMILAAGMSLVHTGLVLADPGQPHFPGPHVGAVLLWAALLLPPLWVLVLGSYVPLAAVLSDFPMTLSMPQPGADAVWVVELGVILIVPVAASAILASRTRETQSEVNAMVHELEEERVHLEEDLARKARELELSLERLSEAQKLESLRTIAAGLAHELNNTLTPIRGLAEILASGQQPDNAERYGRRILHSAVSAASIAEALMTYTRQGTFSPIRTDLCALLDEEVLPAISRKLPVGIQIETDLAEDTHVSADRALIRQCVESLVANSIDAMPEGGTIHLKLRSARCDSGGRVARLSVRDEGVGIGAGELDRVFDPFYTTKAPGTARGLGLPMVEGTVTRHGGRVRIESVPGQGTTVTLELPLAEVDATAPSPTASGPQARPDPVVVVLSEDQDVLDILEELLLELHCTPVCTTSTDVAHRTLAHDGAELLLMDDALLEEAGHVLQTAREPSRDIPVILTVSEPSSPGVKPVDDDPDVVRSPLDTHILSPLVTNLLGADGQTSARAS